MCWMLFRWSHYIHCHRKRNLRRKNWNTSSNHPVENIHQSTTNSYIYYPIGMLHILANIHTHLGTSRHVGYHIRSCHPQAPRIRHMLYMCWPKRYHTPCTVDSHRAHRSLRIYKKCRIHHNCYMSLEVRLCHIYLYIRRSRGRLNTQNPHKWLLARTQQMQGPLQCCIHEVAT